ncbi:ATP-binding protein [Conexibacter sp. DBS9H8]|uniref:hybrid sensor histidine kinase/response regulator n=1 Tax=Conexibacter sp. DBS9H8 TaxID=2937801 RepID=UPI00200F53F0|nr:ATP-binding protein [Conexibacter sp. DBS9H8]
MPRFSIARSLRVALVGLTLTLAVIAAVGVASLYEARQGYENTLVNSAELAGAAANLATASVVVETIAAEVHGHPTAAQRQAAVAYRSAESRAIGLAAAHPVSARLLRAEIDAASANAALAAAGRLQQHQTVRQARARELTRTRSRRALAIIVAAGIVALLTALALVALLIRAMRGPLDALVDATRALADGELGRRVAPAGPQELQQLSTAFNAMASNLEATTARLEHERRRLATTIAGLGDGLLVTEPGSTVIAAANPRAGELVPALAPGTRADGPDSPLPLLQAALDREVSIESRGRTLAISAAQVGPDGAGDGTVWTVRDMTQWAALDRAKSEFIATASHELRSPLTSIKGFVELLAKSGADLTDRQREFVTIILRSTDRLVELVNDLLDVARLEADQVQVRPRAVDVGELLNELAEMMGPRVAARNQRLGVEVAAALPLAWADPARLRQIVQNLLTNAHLYTPDGGHLALSADAREGRVRITVADTGAGMTPEQLARIYDRFYRADDGQGAPGTGLGLSIVRSLVELIGGEIEAVSEPGRGSTFRVSLPAAAAADAGLPPTLEALRGRRVLAVDDERALARLIADQLSPFDVAVTIAGSGREALALARRDRFDAITVDVAMPEMDGVELLRALRADPSLAAIPVVFVSAFADMEQLSGEWIVSKPVDAAELATVLGTAVSMGRTRVLVIARDALKGLLTPSLDALGIPYQWETSGLAAARACSERLFEVALIDVGLSSPQALLGALTLRGRRRRRAVILFEDGVTPPALGAKQLGLEVVPIEAAARSLAAALEPPLTAADGDAHD